MGSRLAVGLCLAVSGLWGQVTSGSLSGYVLDPSGKSIPNAELVLEDELRRVSRTLRTDAGGFYQFRQVAPGRYTLTGSAAGFKTNAVRGVEIPVDSHIRYDAVLTVADVGFQAEVASQVLLSESPELGGVVGRTRMEQLPLNRRDFLQLSQLMPGVLPPVQGSELSGRGSFAMHANGGREEFNNFLLDGVDNNDPIINRYNLQPPVDAIQEFKIATNSYSAEYGRSAAGQVNVVTRSGSNEWHGFGYEYFRNRVLDARNYFTPAEEKNKYARHQFGAGVGGAIRKDRTFFFANGDWFRERAGATRVASVPSLAVRNGDLSGLGATVVDPFTRQPFAGNRIPASRIHPLASRVFAMFPVPNLPGESANLIAQPTGVADESQYNVRGDHYASANDVFTLRYSYGKKYLREPFPEDSPGVPGFGNDVRDRGHNAMLRYQKIFNARTVNSLMLGFSRLERSALPQNAGTDVNALWGVNWLPTNPVNWGFPSVSIAGYSGAGDVTALPLARAANTYQLQDGLSINAGRHALRIGFEARRIQHNGYLNLLTRGSMTFSGALSGSGASDLLLGLLSFSLQARADAIQTLRTTATNYYVQDDWKVARNLTLNLGVRYEYNTPFTDPTNRMSVLNIATGVLNPVGTNGVPRGGYRPDRNNIAPRVGLAWSPGGGKTAVRAGYGLYYDSGLMNANTSLYFNPPYFDIRVFFPTQTSLVTLSDPFPRTSGITPPASLSTLSPDLTQASMHHWNVSLQRDVTGIGVVSLAYAGSKGTHLLRSRDFNQPAPGAGTVQVRRPLPAFSNIFLAESGGNSNYNSLQAMVNRPLRRGVSLLASYTFGKSIDDTSAFLATGADKNFPQNSRDFRAERAVSSFDIRHRANIAATFTKLPLGLQSSVILSANTGQALTPILRFDNSNTGNTGGTYGNDRPNVIGDPNNGPKTADRWFNTGAFAVPAPFTFGNAGRNIVRGPGFASTDVSLLRRFRLTDRVSLQMEGQIFNVFNRTNFNLPERFVDEPTSFGRIFSARAPRQTQLTARIVF
ncbi:hypothetical protein F183_A10710 [Bryobacterales bacterium F-183]|nr:hypothetical protein F183_A10710 [Bryobacterales bacterium F-183]